MALRILLVEKDMTMADLLVPSLERKGFHVAVARTQRQALALIRSVCPDLLVIDVASFGIGGYKIRDTLRTRLSGVPIILLLEKGHDSAGSTAEALMTPPFTSRKLLYRVKKVSESLTSRELRAGNLALDPETRILRRGGESLHLRPKEAALLAYFVNNPGRVLSRDVLLDGLVGGQDPGRPGDLAAVPAVVPALVGPEQDEDCGDHLEQHRNPLIGPDRDGHEGAQRPRGRPDCLPAVRAYLPCVSKDIIYEVRYHQCETSFAPETRRCIHCGAPLARGRRVIAGAERFDPDQVAEDQPEEEGELLSRGPRMAIWVVVALVTAVASVLRSCVE